MITVWSLTDHPACQSQLPQTFLSTETVVLSKARKHQEWDSSQTTGLRRRRYKGIAPRMTAAGSRLPLVRLPPGASFIWQLVNDMPCERPPKPTEARHEVRSTLRRDRNRGEKAWSVGRSLLGSHKNFGEHSRPAISKYTLHIFDLALCRSGEVNKGFLDPRSIV